MALRLAYSSRLSHLVFQSGRRHRYHFKQTLDDVFRGNALRFRMEIRNDAVAEHRVSKGLNVFDRDVIATVHQATRLGAEDQELRGAQAGSVIDVLFDEIRRVGAARATGTRKLDGVAHDG